MSDTGNIPAGADWKPQPGEVAFRVEAWPHNAGEYGEHYSSGCLQAADVVRELRDLANRIESDWAVVVTPAQEET